MAKKILHLVTDHLTEEKWTRLTIANYTINNFLELDALLLQIFESGIEDDVKALCAEQLSNTKNSIVALYLAGIIGLNHQSLDDSNLLSLIAMFNENHRWNIVQHLSQRILEFGENRHALRHLADCYGHEKNTEEQYKIWERLVRADYEEADIVYKLARYEEDNGNTKVAAAYYKRAMHRYINKKDFDQIRDIWVKLMAVMPGEVEFFHHAEGRISKTIGEDQAVELLKIQYPYFQETGDWTTAIKILKRILTCDSKDTRARKNIVECYKEKYAKHSQLQEYIKLSNLSQNWRNIHDAIQDFEKHIAFDVGNFVHHRFWNIGKITDIAGDDITINFIKKKNHKMSLKMAVSSLQVLKNDHIWVYRITKKKEALNKKVKKDPLWALKTVIKSLDNAADLKKIKAELVPNILDAGEWTNWSLKAREMLRSHEFFGNLPDSPDVYTVRDQPMNLEEKIYNRFNAEKDFFGRMKILQDFLDYGIDEGESIESDLFRDMFNYFVSYIRNTGNYNEYTISAMLIVSQIFGRFPFLNPGVNLDFKEYFNNLENYEETFQKINNIELRKLLLTYVRKYKIPNWHEIYINLLPYHLHKELVRELVAENHKDIIIQKFQALYNSYRDRREPYIWFARNFWQDDWFAETGVTHEKILISMIHLLELTAIDAENKRDFPLNRKLNKQVSTFLIKNEVLIDYISTRDEENVGRIYSLLEEVKDMDNVEMSKIRKNIKKRFPKFTFFGEKELALETVSRSGFLSTIKSYESRQRALRNLHDIEVPKNSKEIAAAREYGDLKENAEYKAAKERQEILNTTARKWEEELQSAQVVRPDEVSGEKVGFGTMVTLLNLNTDDNEIVTIMGPWESNPDKKILSYLSPFASKLLNSSVGEKIEFTINQRSNKYEVKKIAAVNFDEIETMPVTV